MSRVKDSSNSLKTLIGKYTNEKVKKVWEWMGGKYKENGS